MTDEEIEAAYQAGRDAWESGADRPPMPKADDVTPESMFWIGFVAACARDFFKRRSIALYPDRIANHDHKPGPSQMTAQASDTGMIFVLR